MPRSTFIKGPVLSGSVNTLVGDTDFGSAYQTVISTTRNITATLSTSISDITAHHRGKNRADTVWKSALIVMAHKQNGSKLVIDDPTSGTPEVEEVVTDDV